MEKIAILTVYMDDIILPGDYYEELARLKMKLTEEFEIKEVGAFFEWNLQDQKKEFCESKKVYP